MFQPIDVLIYSSPKGGGNTYHDILSQHSYKSFYTHNSYFFQSSDPACQNMGITLEEYIQMQIQYRKKNKTLKKLKILFSWREIFEQQISLFFQNLQILDIGLELSTTNTMNFIHYFNNYILSVNEDKNNFFELFPEIELFNFKKINNYYFFETEDIIFYITRFRDIQNIQTILADIMQNKQILKYQVIPKNTSEKKNYKEVLQSFKTEYFIPEYVYQNVKKNNKFLNFLLNEDERTSYFDYWKKKIDNDKSLIIKNNFFILQNDSNLGYYRYITNNTYIHPFYSRNNKLLPFNYFLLLYPDKNIILSDHIPNYVNLHDNNYIENQTFDNNKIFLNLNINDETDFYKYDTHMNLKGTLKNFQSFIKFINNSTRKKIKIPEEELQFITQNPLCFDGYSDLLWATNIDTKKFENIKLENEFEYISKYEKIYMNSISNIKKKYENFSITNKKTFKELCLEDDKIVDWKIISNNIIININDKLLHNNISVLVYYDSFSLSLLPILFNNFKKCITVKESFKNNMNFSTYYKTDLILDLKCFRFCLN